MSTTRTCISLLASIALTGCGTVKTKGGEASIVTASGTRVGFAQPQNPEGVSKQVYTRTETTRTAPPKPAEKPAAQPVERVERVDGQPERLSPFQPEQEPFVERTTKEEVVTEIGGAQDLAKILKAAESMTRTGAMSVVIALALAWFAWRLRMDWPLIAVLCAFGAVVGLITLSPWWALAPVALGAVVYLVFRAASPLSPIP